MGTWRIGVIATALVTAASAGLGMAADEVATDSLSGQLIRFDPNGHHGMLVTVAESRIHSDSLSERAALTLLSNLWRLESACRSDLFSKEAEPGSPWLQWRSLAHADLDSCALYVGALSCADLVCGQRVAHERLTVLCVGRDRTEATLFPPEPSTIHDEGTAVVDSATIFTGRDHVLVQARRRLSSDHPCYGGPDFRSSEDTYFVVLRGARVVQAFAVVSDSANVSHDDVDGDGGTDLHGTLTVLADAVRMDYTVDDWAESLDGNPAKTQHQVRPGVVRFEYRPKAGRFARVK